MDKATVGVIGLGVMGGNMARNIIKAGYPLVAYDLNSEIVKTFVALGAQPAKNSMEVGEKASIILTSLPAPPHVKEAYLGEAGILKGAKKGAIAIELSTIDTGTMWEIDKAAKEKGIEVLDAPVGGSKKEAEEGTLLIWVAGSQAALAKCEGVFAALGKTINCGEKVGTAKTIKLVNNLMANGNMMIAMEAFILGLKMGLEPQFLYDVLVNGGGSSVNFQRRFPKVLKGDFENVSFAAGLATKDAKLALTMAMENQVPMPVNTAVLQMCLATLASGWANEDINAVVKIYEAWAGVSARAGTKKKS
jgi:3-hydroxyisobutyrate dehydrogenase-like beta-hydroxyacid dehydrogenase